MGRTQDQCAGAAAASQEPILLHHPMSNPYFQVGLLQPPAMDSSAVGICEMGGAWNDMRTLVSSSGHDLQSKPWLPASSKLEIIDPFRDPSSFFMLPNQVSNVGMSLLQGSIGSAAPNNCMSAATFNTPVVSSSTSAESFKPPHLQLITPRTQWNELKPSTVVVQSESPAQPISTTAATEAQQQLPASIVRQLWRSSRDHGLVITIQPQLQSSSWSFYMRWRMWKLAAGAGVEYQSYLHRLLQTTAVMVANGSSSRAWVRSTLIVAEGVVAVILLRPKTLCQNANAGRNSMKDSTLYELWFPRSAR
jgi:hypothetical protein